MANTTKIKLFILLIAQLLEVYSADKLCWKIDLREDRSPVCMCTAEYCDEITREKPSLGNYTTYISSESGLRFFKKVESLQYLQYRHPDHACPARDCSPTFFLDPTTLYKEIQGFGGSISDAAAITWASLQSDELKQHYIDSYFSERGIEYNLLRVPIGGSDFSTHPYAYNELPIDDVTLSNFTLSREDYDYKLPMIKEAFKVATDDVHIVASTWSPPGWMKTNNAIFGSPSFLKEEYYQTYADYHLKFIEEYAKEGVPVWGITTGNEPSDGAILNTITFNKLGWMVPLQGEWIANNLGPTIRNSSFKDVKIIGVDDQRDLIAHYFTMLITYIPEALPYIDGIGVHYYLNLIVPPEQTFLTLQDYPHLFLISTEACTGAGLPPSVERGIDFGSWHRAQIYIKDVLETLNHNGGGWIDWNMSLNEQGGPSWDSNYVDAPIIVSDDGQKIYKQPMFYALGHVSKFLSRGSRKIRVETLCENTVENVSFLTPDNTVVTILHNTGESTVVELITCNQVATVEMERKSIATVELNYEECTDVL